MFFRGCQGVMVSGAGLYLVGFLWDLVMGNDGPDWQVGPLWVPRPGLAILSLNLC